MEARTYREAIKAGQSHPFDQPTAIVLTSYEFAARRADDLRLIAWDLVVFDEAHRLRKVYKPSGIGSGKSLA